MYIWLIERTDLVNYDEYDAIVVAAKTEDAARAIEPEYGWGNRVDLETLTVTRIGTATRGTVAGTVILASYNAG